MQRLREAKEKVRKKREGDEEKKDEGERVGREREMGERLTGRIGKRERGEGDRKRMKERSTQV